MARVPKQDSVSDKSVLEQQLAATRRFVEEQKHVIVNLLDLVATLRAENDSLKDSLYLEKTKGDKIKRKEE